MKNLNKTTPSVKKRFLPFFIKIGVPFLAISLIVGNWLTADIIKSNFVYNVQPSFQISVFESHFLYFFTHLMAFIPVFLLSFDKKVAFYKTWKSLFPALLIVSVVFWLWDIVKTDYEVWGFNPRYYTFLLGNLPIEEWLFFITFPFCSVFIYECLNKYFPHDTLKHLDRPLSILFSIGFFLIGIIFWTRSYTATTWIPAGLFALWHFLYIKNTYRTYFYRAFFISLCPFFLINSIFTGATTLEPIVVYNPNEYLGIRVGTVPLDDFVYNFLLQFMVISLFERFKNAQNKLSTSYQIKK